MKRGLPEVLVPMLTAEENKGKLYMRFTLAEQRARQAARNVEIEKAKAATSLKSIGLQLKAKAATSLKSIGLQLKAKGSDSNV